MKNILCRGLVIGTLGLCASQAALAERSYVGIAAGELTGSYKDEEFLSGNIGRIYTGAEVENTGIEIRYDAGGESDAKLKYNLGFVFRKFIPVPGLNNLRAYIGGSGNFFDIDLPGNTADRTQFSFGLQTGLSYLVSESLALNLEYSEPFRTSSQGREYEMLSLGIEYSPESLFTGSDKTSSSTYTGVIFSQADIDDNSADEDSPKSISLRLGKHINNYLSAELRYGQGLSDANNESGANYELDDYYGGYLKANTPDFVGISPYLIVGISSVKIGSSNSVKSTEPSQGAGIEFQLNDMLKLQLEYMELFDAEGLDLTTTSAGFSFYF